MAIVGGRVQTLSLWTADVAASSAWGVAVKGLTTAIARRTTVAPITGVTTLFTHVMGITTAVILVVTEALLWR